MNDVSRSRAPGARSARRRSREFAMQGLYQWLVSGEERFEIQTHLSAAPEFGLADLEHFEALLGGVMGEVDALHELLTPQLDRPVRQLSPVEHAVLLLGAYEMLHHPEIPYRVVINEGVELTKSFGGTDGFKFVNGVLDKLAAAIRPQEAAGGRRGPSRRA